MKIFDESELKKLLKKCWNASDAYNDQLRRIGQGLSNFDNPTYPNFNEWVEKIFKKLDKEEFKDLPDVEEKDKKI